MAYWTIDFKTRTNRSIHIEISGKQGNTDEALTPAATPLVIQEEGDEDLFVPVKTQSGYITILSDNIGLMRSIIPIQGATHRVYVYEVSGNDLIILWDGYVQPRMLSFNLWRGKITMQIPIECPLSALRYQNFVTAGKFMTIAQLMYKLTKDFDNVVIQGTFPAINGVSTDYVGSSWLAKKFYTSVFTNGDMSNLDVLENLCTFFGWTCRCGKDSSIDQDHDKSVYFIQNRNTDYIGRRDLYVLQQSQLNAATPTGTKMSGWIEQTFPENGIADTKCELVLFEGIKNAIAECAIDGFNFQVDVMDDDYEDDIENWQQTKVETTTQVVGLDTYYWSQIQNEIAGDWSFSGYNAHAGINKNNSLDKKDWEYYLEVLNTANTDVQHQVPGDSGSMETDYYEITSYYQGYLNIDQVSDTDFNGKGILSIDFHLQTGEVTTDKVIFYLRIVIGQNTWHYNPTDQTWDEQGGDVECTTKDGKFDAYIPEHMPGETVTVKGKIQIHIPTWNGKSIRMNGLSMNFKIKSDTIIDSDISRVEYSSESGFDFSTTKNFDSKLCVNEELTQKSQNVILNDDETPCDSLVDSPSPYTTPFNPLQRLVDEAAAEGSKVGEMLKMNIRSESASEDISPLTVFEMQSMDEMYYPVSITRDYRDEVTKLKLVKRNYNEEY